MKRTGSLRRKVLWVVMAATCAALLMSSFALLFYEVSSFRRDWVGDLGSQAGLIARSAAPALAFDDAKAARDTLAALKGRPQILAAAIYRADGRLFAAYKTNAEPTAELPAAPRADGSRFDGDELELSQQIVQNGERLGVVYLRARHDVAGRVADYALILVLSMAAGLAVAALIFRQLHPTVTRPILAMAEVARQVTDSRDYGLRVTESSDDEVGELVQAFNDMLHDLEAEMHERQRAEEALRAADRRKDEFLATLAHELRNPLAPIANGLAILKRADDDAPMRQATRAMMERQVAQMVRLIDDLLDVSRITTGKLQLRRERVELGGIVRNALEAAEPALRARRQAVTSELPAAPIWVDADAVRLAQVFVNLLHNAAKYTPPGGHIGVRVGAQGGEASVEVQDDGIGIDASQQAAIFDMFTQVDKSLERGAAGLGIGLTIARQLVELHGGTIGVHSAGLGQGALFRVTLAVAAAPAALREAPQDHAALSGGPLA
jgi:signal transduction histidine kinase